jgi:hypothetical protein
MPEEVSDHPLLKVFEKRKKVFLEEERLAKGDILVARF